MDLQYQLRATCYIHELPEINGKFVRAAGCDLRLLHKEELENLCMTFLGRGLVHGRSLVACDTIISRGKAGFGIVFAF